MCAILKEYCFVCCLQEEELAGAILVVLANKQDMEGCMTVAEVHHALGLENLKNRTFQIFKTSATKGEGLDQAMDWLSNTLQSRKQCNQKYRKKLLVPYQLYPKKKFFKLFYLFLILSNYYMHFIYIHIKQTRK